MLMSTLVADTVSLENGTTHVSLDIRDAVLIVNPQAGGGRKMRHLDEARRIFHKAGIETELHNTTGPGDATVLARQAVAQSRQLVIVCGGDGTVNEAVNGLARTQVPLSVLPAGTANVLAKELSLPWNLPRAAERLIHAQYRRIALGLAIPEKSSGEPRYFLSVAGAGADGALVIVGRTKHYGGPFKITTEADLHRPEFELMFVKTRSAWRYIAYLPLIWAGQLRRAKYVEFHKANSLHCAAIGSSSVLIQVDGEPAGSLPAEFRIVPDALTLAIPKSV
jgi:diacylglycerol kinase (ATP)